MEKCPGCDLLPGAEDLENQMAHMAERHPEIVAARRSDAARLDGWVDEG